MRKKVTKSFHLGSKCVNDKHSQRKLGLTCGLSLCFILLPLSANADNSKPYEKASPVQQEVQQSRKVIGTVTDEYGESLIGASILVKGTTVGTITDVDGNFSIEASADATLLVSYIGHETKEVKVGNQTKLDVNLRVDGQLVDEVVVVGYGVVKKSDLTGAVGSVKSETIAAKGTTSIMESLQGQVAGVNISQSSSRAGDGFDIQIRGKSSLGGGSPLYVIDGVVCESMDFLNPMDIEKVDILKDASSTAIYGSRATNGVVMITTKKGEGSDSAKATISYDGYYGVKTVANMPDFMDGTEWMKWRYLRYLTSSMDVNTGLTEWEMTNANYSNTWCMDSPVWMDMYKNKNYTDWVDNVTRDGSQQNHFINISGNAKDISYRVGIGYQNEEGIMYDQYERWNIKGAVDHKISDKVSAGFSTNMATSTKNSGSQNSIVTGFRMSPMMPGHYWEGPNIGRPIYQPGKDEAIYPFGGGPTSVVNPIVDRENSKDDTESYDVMANLYLQYNPIKDVILKTTFSPMYNKAHRGQFYGSESNVRAGKSNMVVNNNMETFAYTWDTQANYIKNFGDHSLNALALFSMYQRTEKADEMTVTGMPFDVDWHNLGSGTVENQSSYFDRVSMISYVGRINYGYKGKYLLTVSSRWDGSSKFQKKNRWGMFPSAALAWRISEEDFMSSTSDVISNLKLRTSIGLTGNNAGVGSYATQSLADVKYYYNFGDAVSNGYGFNMSNALLTWEKTTEINLGLDFGFFNNRISGAIDVYNKDSKDLLMDMKLPYEVGSVSGSVVSNVGKVNNKGIEVQLNTINVKTKNLTWETSFSFARNVNSIVELNGKKEDLVGNKWFIDQPIDVVYNYKYLGITTREEAQAFAKDPNMGTKFYEGEMKIFDKDENGKIDANDMMIMGHCAPSWTGSFTSNLSYRNVDFSVGVYTSQGSTVYSPFMAEFTDYGQRGMMRLNMDFYIPEGAPILGEDGKGTYQASTYYGTYPFPTNGNNNKGAGSNWYNEGTKDFVDNSFTKIKNITLGYTFPRTWMSKYSISNLRIYANLLNPFTFTSYKGFDPEWATSTISDGKGGVSSRSYQIGVNLKF